MCCGTIQRKWMDPACVLFSYKTWFHVSGSLHIHINKYWSAENTILNHQAPIYVLIIKPTRCTNFSILFLEWKLYMFWTVPLSIIRSFSPYTLTRFCPDPARKLSAILYDIYHCCVYSEKLLMMDRGTVWNMWVLFQSKFEKLVHLGFIIRIYQLYGHLNVMS